MTELEEQAEEIFVGKTDDEEDEVSIEKSLLHSENDEIAVEVLDNDQVGESLVRESQFDVPVTDKRKNSASCNCLFVKRFLILFFSKLGVCSFLQVFIFILMFVVAAINAAAGYGTMKFYTKTLASISAQRFVEAWGDIICRTFFSMIGTACEFLLKNGLIDYWLFYLWRKNLTKNLLKKYFSRKNYYVILNMKEESIDNPDQRIQSDAKDFCLNLSSLICNLVYLAMMVAVNLYYMIETRAFWLFIPVVLYPIISSVGYTVFFTPVSKNIFRKDSLEGDFRFSHARIRENAESVSFFRSEKVEESHINRIYDQLKKALYGLSCKMFMLTTWATMGNFVPSVTYIFILVLFSFADIQPYYEGMDAESLVNVTIESYVAAMALSQTINGMLSLGQFLGIVIGNATRISEMFEQMNKIENEEKKIEKMHDAVHESPNSVTFDGVTVQTPMTRKVLFDNLSFSVHEGEHLLIMGESGSGKTSILRTLSGLWSVERGKVHKPFKIGAGGMFYLPQKPYILRKSLKENLVYPRRLEQCRRITDEEFFSVLDIANIASVLKIGALDDEDVCWDEKLSLGEQQRLQMARLFMAQPKFAILDECTSALDPENEEKVYTSAQSMGITCISIAHRRSVQKYHDYVLNVHDDGSGRYDIRRIDKTLIPTYEYEWTVLRRHELSEEERIQNLYESEEEGKKGVEYSDKHLGSTGLNFAFLRRSCRLCCCCILIRPWSMWVFVVFAVIVQVIVAFTPVLLFTGSGSILTAMVDRDLFMSIFFSMIVIAGFFLFAFGSGLGMFLFMIQGVCCRTNVTRYLQERYFRNNIYYEVNVIDKQVDNVDQRITNDVDLMTSGFLWNPGLSFLQFTFITAACGIFLSLVMSALLVSIWLPVYAIVTYFFMGAIQTVYTIIVARLQFLQQKREGFFRFSLIRMKENSEQIAFLNGKEIEREIIEKKFEYVMKSQFWLYFVTALSAAFQNFMGSLSDSTVFTIILFSIYLGFLNLDGMSSGEILGTVQSLSNMMSSVVLSFLNALTSLLILGSTIGTVGRIGQFIEKMDRIDKRKKKEAKLLGEGTPKSRRVDVIDWVGVENLTGETPTKKTLFNNLHFEVKIGEHTIIRGPSGCGKSSLMRIICGLWEVDPKNWSCRIYVPQSIYFIPQKPYLAPGNLQSQIIYPDEEMREGMTNEDLEHILNEVNLGYLLNRVGGWDSTRKEWSNVISPGEVQRLGVARLLYHKPTFAILDESTSSLDEKNEKLVYDLCRRNRITTISVGHRLSLFDSHSHVLEFTGTGGWVWKKKAGDGENIGEIREVERGSFRESIKRKSLEYRKSVKSRSINYRQKLDQYDQYRKTIGKSVRRRKSVGGNSVNDIELQNRNNNEREEEIAIEVIRDEEELDLGNQGSDVVFYPQPSRYEY